MLLGIFFMGLLIFLVWKAYQAAVQAQKSIEQMKENVEEKVVGFVTSRPTQVAQAIGTGLSAFLIKKIRDAFNKKNDTTSPEA